MGLKYIFLFFSKLRGTLNLIPMTPLKKIKQRRLHSRSSKGQGKFPRFFLFIYFGPTHVKNGCVPRSRGIRHSFKRWTKKSKRRPFRMRPTDGCHFWFAEHFNKIYGALPEKQQKRTQWTSPPPPPAIATTTPFGAFCRPCVSVAFFEWFYSARYAVITPWAHFLSRAMENEASAQQACNLLALGDGWINPFEGPISLIELLFSLTHKREN